MTSPIRLTRSSRRFVSFDKHTLNALKSNGIKIVPSLLPENTDPIVSTPSGTTIDTKRFKRRHPNVDIEIEAQDITESETEQLPTIHSTTVFEHNQVEAETKTQTQSNFTRIISSTISSTINTTIGNITSSINYTEESASEGSAREGSASEGLAIAINSTTLPPLVIERIVDNAKRRPRGLKAKCKTAEYAWTPMCYRFTRFRRDVDNNTEFKISYNDLNKNILEQSELQWIPVVLENVMTNKTNPAVVSGMDVIARRIIGPHNLERLKKKDEIFIQQLRDQCKSAALTRTSRGLLTDPDQQRHIRAVFNRGNQIIKQNLPTQVEYIQIPPDPSLKKEDRTLVSMLCAVLGFMVCCTVGLVGRHHGDSITKTYQNTEFGSVSKLGIVV